MQDVAAGTGAPGAAGALAPDAGGTPGPSSAGGAPRDAGRWGRSWEGLDRSGLRAFWVATAVLLGLELVLFVAVSTFRYHRFDLYTDFGTYAQAFSVIAHGNLDPFDTFQTYPFWQNHFELAMWPIGLLGSVWPHPIVLLWLQDIAVVATELVALLWIGRICAERVGARRQQVALVALVATVANAWWWEATIFDVHFEAFGMPFALLSAYALWRGHYRTAWAAALVGLLFGDVVALSILFVGVAGLLSARVRSAGRGVWHAAGLAALGVAWLVLVTALHGNRGSAVPLYYGWIVHEPPNASSWAVFGALAAHPSADLHVLRTQAGAMWRVVATGGALGLLTPWGLLQAIAVLVPVALNVNGPFWLLPAGAFQTVTAVPFVLVGTVMVLVWVGTGQPEWPRLRSGHGRRQPATWRGPAAWVLGAAALALALTQSLPLWDQLASGWDTPSILSSVSGPAAAQLRAVQANLPAGAELVVSGGVVGRFTDRQAVYPVEPAPQNPIPITSGTVVFVLTDQGEEGVTSSGEQADVAYVAHQLGATTLVHKNGVTALVWHPSRGTPPLVLPTTSAAARP
jgi:hypothetical protein